MKKNSEIVLTLTVKIPEKEWAKYYEYGTGHKPSSRDVLLADAEDYIPSTIMSHFKKCSVPVESVQLSGPDKPVWTKDSDLPY